jgi:integral membrane protein
MTSGPLAARWFRVIATFEAISWTALLIAMFLKWIVEAPHEGGVPVVGMVHGIGFVVYLLSTVWAARALRWSFGTLVVGLVAGVPPFGTVVFERWVQRRGLLTTRSRRSATAAAAPSRG